jgi:hypothetical protein
VNYVLVVASEGNTERIVAVSGTQEELLQLIRKTMDEEIAAFPLPWEEGNQGFVQKERDALIAMVESEQWPVGVHKLKPLEPLWQEHLLAVYEKEITHVY